MIIIILEHIQKLIVHIIQEHAHVCWVILILEIKKYVKIAILDVCLVQILIQTALHVILDCIEN